ncbi:biofilm regulation protein phosphatase SiaA [Billgrantia kenyensis]|uniref:SpoIIE family protein phosphatase n=1 Tax=Billgrantia kenyensis TaxID=321266 RepID=A0A7V9W325_9GAMM|nr:biofilm regulation protein phosphatase SiaA [Halomonas kenyensis]MBA2780157.1 SpoIIE family protein phosphatase [Halomonas kenyensis]MCG6663056.1 SpoIIE family protein phosphatase [Halomonas kenyensis]
MAVHLGLRGKSVATLLLACLLALIPALLIGWKAVDEVRRHFATAYAEQYTLLQMQRISAPVSRELALSRRFANSVVTREWLRQPDDPERRERFFAEAEGFRQHFGSNTYFIIDHASRDYYFADRRNAEPAPHYRLSADDDEHAWYFATMASTSTYDITIQADPVLERSMLWVNVKVHDDGELLGLAGGALDLDDFLTHFIRASAPGVTPMIVDPRGTIRAHPDQARVALGAGSSPFDIDSDQHIQSLIADNGQRDELRRAMQGAIRRPGDIQALNVDIQGEPRLLSVGYIPELQWLLVTSLDKQAAPILEGRWFWPLVGALILVLSVLTAAFAYATHRLILMPLHRLTLSARAIADGDYRSRLPTERHDEIGELSQAFSHMARQVEDHTVNLEAQVRERTRELETAHSAMAAAHKQLGDSIQYASIIQQAILPDAQLKAHLDTHYAVLWQPRDTVGGDFYIFRATPRGYLIGIVDCAGHGVPGALMTMLARAIIDNAIAQEGADNPAALLNEIDHQSRELLPESQLPSSIATNMDIGLAWVDLDRHCLTYAGAKLDLYASDGNRLERIKGHKRALGHRRPTRYSNQQVPLHDGWRYYLCSDGFLDQAGGDHGFGFGNSRFEELLLSQAASPLDAQLAAFEQALDDYRGAHSQRDDITLLIFCSTSEGAGPVSRDPPPSDQR